jgi:hypothetical protein
MTTQTQHLVTKEVAQSISRQLSELAEKLLAEQGLKLNKVKSNFGDLYKFTIEATAVQLSDDGIDMGSDHVVRYQRNGYIGWVNDNYASLTAPVGTRFQIRGKEYALVGTRARGTQKIIAKEIGADRYVTLGDSVITAINARAGLA